MALSNTKEPSAAEYAGDEVSAIVLDPGYNTTRAGFAGEDTPKSILPTYYADVDGKHIFGDHFIDSPRANIAIENVMNREGIVQDWDTAERLFKYSFVSNLTGARPRKELIPYSANEAHYPTRNIQNEAEETERCLEDNPLFMTEPPNNPTKAREKAIEIAFEQWGTPAFYLGRTGVMSAFAAGKSIALVVDIGASQTCVTPVYDGIMLKKGAVRSPLAGNYISSQIRASLASNQPPITITPRYLFKNRSRVEAGEPASIVPNIMPPEFRMPQPSFRAYQEESTLKEFKETVLEAWTGPSGLLTTYNGINQEELAKTHSPRHFEFPDGYHQDFSSERYRIVESLFDHRAYIPPPPDSEDAALYPAPTAEQTLPAMIKQAVNACDVDIRPHLLSSIVVVGGASLLTASYNSIVTRLDSELNRMIPSTRIRITSPGNVYERVFSSWVGGSILASLGTFHQLWISRKEYTEGGAGIVEKRCK
ncbi:MAG: hypothetical protein Q9160_002104 [Pyrenula sp. 1 TL-2023]